MHIFMKTEREREHVSNSGTVRRDYRKREKREW
jgi:hypothetical protein